MSKLNSKLLATAVLATALVAGCGGGGGDSGGGGVQVQQPTNPATSAQGVVDFLLRLFASDTSDLNDPMPTDSTTFATEELAEPSPI